MEVKSDNVNDIIGVKKEEEEKEEKINVNNNETKINNNNNDSSPNTDGTERRVKETEDKPPLNPIHIDDEKTEQLVAISVLQDRNKYKIIKNIQQDKL